MYPFLLLLSAEAFDVRQAADEVLRAAWPLSAPVYLAGLGSDSPEVRFRCERGLRDCCPRLWRGLPLLRRPATALAMVAGRTMPRLTKDPADSAAARVLYEALGMTEVGEDGMYHPRVVWLELQRRYKVESKFESEFRSK